MTCSASARASASLVPSIGGESAKPCGNNNPLLTDCTSHENFCAASAGGCAATSDGTPRASTNASREGRFLKIMLTGECVNGERDGSRTQQGCPFRLVGGNG